MANTERQRLLSEIASLEKRFGRNARSARSRRSDEDTLNKQIAQLEDVLGPGDEEEYFEEEYFEEEVLEEVLEDVPLEAMDEDMVDLEAQLEEAPLEEALLDVELEEAPLNVDDELACLSCDDDEELGLYADTGVENEITQDSLTEVEEEADSSVPTVEPKSAYTARLKEASLRLDRVASYLEKHGKIKMAYRIDKLADAVDIQLSNAQ